jgi:hypothetical protein
VPQRRAGASFADIVGEATEKSNSKGASAKKTSTETSSKSFALWQNLEFGIGDFIDIINPLQHVPIVATIYRNLTGDRIGMAPRVIGGALWGRIGGFVAGIVNAAVEWFTGKDIGDHIYAAMFGGESTSKPTIAQAGQTGREAKLDFEARRASGDQRRFDQKTSPAASRGKLARDASRPDLLKEKTEFNFLRSYRPVRSSQERHTLRRVA